MLILMASETEARFTSVERILSYMKVRMVVCVNLDNFHQKQNVRKQTQLVPEKTCHKISFEKRFECCGTKTRS